MKRKTAGRRKESESVQEGMTESEIREMRRRNEGEKLG
jgi:hypothetical protein